MDSDRGSLGEPERGFFEREPSPRPPSRLPPVRQSRLPPLGYAVGGSKKDSLPSLTEENVGSPDNHLARRSLPPLGGSKTKGFLFIFTLSGDFYISLD